MGKLTTELAETVKLVVSGSTLRTVMVFELVAFCWGDEDAFACSPSVGALIVAFIIEYQQSSLCCGELRTCEDLWHQSRQVAVASGYSRIMSVIIVSWR